MAFLQLADLQWMYYWQNDMLGSGALSGKMLLVRIVKNNKIYAYFRAG